MAELRLIFKGIRWWWFIIFAGLNVAGAGVAVNLMLAGDSLHLLAWGTGAAFIPTLALVLGVWSGSNKLFFLLFALAVLGRKWQINR